MNWLSAPFAKSLVIPLSSAEKERIGFVGPRTTSRVLVPSITRKSLKSNKLMEGKMIGSKGKAPMKRASTEKVCGPSPSKAYYQLA